MESKSKSKLPPVFKMSVLCNILPYYGYLHQWKRLLTEINSSTHDIWKNNEESLLYIGRDIKEERELTFKDIRKIKRRWINLYLLYWCKPFGTQNKIGRDLISVIDCLFEHEVIVFKKGKSRLNYFLPGVKNDFEDYFQIYFWKEEHISNILPAILCPSFKKEKRCFKPSESESLRKFIYNQIELKALVIEKKHNEVVVYPVFDPYLLIENDKSWNENAKMLMKERNEIWPIKKWACRPTMLYVNTYQENEERCNIEELPCLENIHDVHVIIRRLRNKNLL